MRSSEPPPRFGAFAGVLQWRSGSRDPVCGPLLPLILAASDFGRPMVAPPGVPPARVKILRDAYLKTLADPDLLAEAKRKNLDISPTPGEELQELAKQVMVQTPEIVAGVKMLME